VNNYPRKEKRKNKTGVKKTVKKEKDLRFPPNKATVKLLRTNSRKVKKGGKSKVPKKAG